MSLTQHDTVDLIVAGWSAPKTATSTARTRPGTAARAARAGATPRAAPAGRRPPASPGIVEQVLRSHHDRFGGEEQALQAVACALDERRSLVLTRARYEREAAENGVVINLANVVSVRVSKKDGATTGQYL